MFRCKELVWPQEGRGGVHLFRQVLNLPILGQTLRPVLASAKRYSFLGTGATVLARLSPKVSGTKIRLRTVA